LLDRVIEKGESLMNERGPLIQQLLDLPFEERKHLRDLLEESLHAERLVDDASADAWTAEIDRRIEEYRRSEMEAKPWPEFRTEKEKMLAERRRSAP
jgi:hypothetical protein